MIGDFQDAAEWLLGELQEVEPRIDVARAGSALLILARDFESAYRAATVLGLPPGGSWRWVSNAHDLHMRLHIRVHYGPGYDENPNWSEISCLLDHVRQHGTVEEI